jgi:hypothetical protein
MALLRQRLTTSNSRRNFKLHYFLNAVLWLVLLGILLMLLFLEQGIFTTQPVFATAISLETKIVKNPVEIF